MVGNDTITTKEAGAILGVEPSRVRQLIIAGELEAEKVGRDNLLKRQDVEKLKKARERKAA